ncbi:MAG: protein-disulfide reductase DsbD [Gammaproteobacteria bacterium]|nr:protein-disulfide reductase DsbD [Gammaproteobacteria bacterium]
MKRVRYVALVGLALAAASAAAQGLLGGVTREQEFLPVDEAFVFQAYADSGPQVTLDWQIAPGYYLYRHRISARSLTPGVVLGAPELPTGLAKTDEFFGDVEVYFESLLGTVPVQAPAGVTAFDVEVGYQGCAEAGLCYPPVRKTIRIDVPPPAAAPVPGEAPMVAEQDRLFGLIAHGSLAVVLASFFGFGLLLAFTPCVLPMIPILSGIVAGQGAQATPGRSFRLSLAYVLGMAVTYTAAGAAFAAAGQQAQAFFQQPWILIAFALLFVVLALAMFGLFELRVPAAVESRLSAWSDRQRAGTYTGTVLIGALSALIVSACVAPPLVAALAVISQAGDIARGALALFAMSLGMGTPLLLVGVAGGRLLPRAGPWMVTVRAMFGVLFLAVAVWMLGRVLPGPATLALWAMLALIAGYYLGFGRGRAAGAALHVARGAGGLLIAWGLVMLAGAATGGTDPLNPLRNSRLLGAPVAALPFRSVASVTELERELAAARSAGQPVLLDFYADWCASCKEMEKYTFADAGVRQDLSGFLLLKADVTANSPEDQALLQRFGTFGPPTTAFFGPHGRECRNFRLVGFVAADEFRGHLARFARECHA